MFCHCLIASMFIGQQRVPCSLAATRQIGTLLKNRNIQKCFLRWRKWGLAHMVHISSSLWTTTFSRLFPSPSGVFLWEVGWVLMKICSLVKKCLNHHWHIQQPCHGKVYCNWGKWEKRILSVDFLLKDKTNIMTAAIPCETTRGVNVFLLCTYYLYPNCASGIEFMSSASLWLRKDKSSS